MIKPGPQAHYQKGASMNHTEQRSSRSTSSIVATLKSDNADFQWYPTTDEIIRAIKADMEEEFFFSAPSVLDCGAGDGRVLQALTKGARYAIEKSQPLIDLMDPSIFVVGTEFEHQTLIDKKTELVFANPPYSHYAEWARKIILEANCRAIYLVLPERWQDNDGISQALELRNRAQAEIVGEFDFLDADRKARVNVHLIRIDLSPGSRRWGGSYSDPFDIWFDQHFAIQAGHDSKSEFEWKSSISSDVKSKVSSELVNGGDLIQVLEKLYQRDMEELIGTYKKLEEIAPLILSELNVNLKDVKQALYLKITSLKDAYWQELFNNFRKITDKLCHGSRRKMLDKLNSHTHVDFSAANAYAIMIWVIKNSNSYFDSQLIGLVETMTEKANVALYKSNQRTYRDDDWRYCRTPEDLNRYSLDYRIVLERCGGISVSEYAFERTEHGLTDRAAELLGDIMTVATNIGFDTTESERPKEMQWERGKSQTIYYYDHVTNSTQQLMDVKAYKNGNLHIKLNQAFNLRLNVLFGKLKGWLKDRSQAAEELDVTIEQVNLHFGTNMKIGIATAKMLLLGAA